MNNNLYTSYNNTNNNVVNNINDADKPYIILDDKSLKNKQRNNKILTFIIYSMFIVVGFIVFYMFRIDKYEFYLKQDEVLIENGSNYQIELTPKNSEVFDYLNYKYSIDNNEIAEVSDIGTIVAKNIGTTNVRIKYKNSFISKVMKIIVSDVNVQMMDVPETVVISNEESIKIEPVVNNQENINVSINYESNNPEVASVDEYGNVNPVNTGEATIVAKTKSGEIEEIKVVVEEKSNTVTPTPVPTPTPTPTPTPSSPSTDNKPSVVKVEEINLNIKNTTLNIGGTLNLNATIKPENATDKGLAWSSSNENVVKIANGQVTAVGEGSAVVTVKGSNNKSDSCIIVVKKAEIVVSNVVLDKSNIDLFVNDRSNVSASVNPIDATNKNITFSSSNPSVASVDNSGNIQAISAGNTIISATSSNGKVATCKVFVYNHVIDTTPPSGSCTSVLKNGKTTITVESNSSIKAYEYNGVQSTSNVYIVDGYLRSSSVTLIGNNNQTSNIACSTRLEALDAIKPSGNIVYSASSNTLKVNVVKTDKYYLSYVWAYDVVNQLKKQLTSGSSKIPEEILNIAIKEKKLNNKIMLGFNASDPVNSTYWTELAKNSKYNLREASPLLIYNGTVLINDYSDYPVNRQIYYVDGSNQLRYIPSLKKYSVDDRKKIFQDVINAGTQNTFAFTQILVDNFKTVTLANKDLFSQSARRQALCQLDSNNYVVLTSINGVSSSSVSVQTIANYLAKLGCKTAVNLDGGGSSALFFKKAGTSKLTTVTGGGRELTSAMYFTE